VASEAQPPVCLDESDVAPRQGRWRIAFPEGSAANTTDFPSPRRGEKSCLVDIGQPLRFACHRLISVGPLGAKNATPYSQRNDQANVQLTRMSVIVTPPALRREKLPQRYAPQSLTKHATLVRKHREVGNPSWQLRQRLAENLLAQSFCAFLNRKPTERYPGARRNSWTQSRLSKASSPFLASRRIQFNIHNSSFNIPVSFSRNVEC